ncbi:MAG: glycosyltransferase [Dehalococcoidia bacterium]
MNVPTSSVAGMTRLRPLARAIGSALALVGVVAIGIAAVRRVLPRRGAPRGVARGAAQRVLVISEHDFPSHPLLYRNIDALLLGGAHVDLVCAGEGPAIPETRPSLRIHRVRMDHRRTSRLRYLVEYFGFFFASLPTVWWWSLRNRYDTVQVDNMPDFLVFSAVVARLRGARVILCLFELMPELTAVRLGLSNGHPVVRVVRALEWLALAWSDHVIAVNQACREVLLARGLAPDRVTVVPNTVPFPEALREPIAHQPVVVTHATLVERYGVHVALEAFARLHRARPELRMLVLGTGEELPRLRALADQLGIADRVEFTGFLPWYQAMSRIRECSVGVVPVLSDGYGQYMVPMKIYDYVTMGVPAVSSRLAAVQDYFPEDALSYVPPGDPAALASAIERLIDDPEAATRQQAAAEHAMSAIEWETAQVDYYSVIGLDAPAARDRTREAARVG